MSLIFSSTKKQQKNVKATNACTKTQKEPSTKYPSSDTIPLIHYSFLPLLPPCFRKWLTTTIASSNLFMPEDNYTKFSFVHVTEMHDILTYTNRRISLYFVHFIKLYFCSNFPCSFLKLDYYLYKAENLGYVEFLFLTFAKDINVLIHGTTMPSAF